MSILQPVMYKLGIHLNRDLAMFFDLLLVLVGIVEAQLLDDLFYQLV